MFVDITIFTLLILSVNCNLKIIDPEFPEYSNMEYNMSKMLSSASPYNIVENCEPIKAWFLTRHGTKYPSEKVLNGISQKLVPKIQGLILRLYAKESDQNFSKLENYQKIIIRKIKNWENVTASGSHKNLNDHGKLLMENLGERWNEKLKLLTKHLKQEEIEVLSAIEDRCVVSGKKFLRKFYEGDYDEIDVKRALKNDMRLKLVKPPKSLVYVRNPDNEELVPVEDIHFKNNSAPIIEKIQKLLFPDHVDNYVTHRDQITGEIVQIMYSACAHSFYYEDGDETKTDAWCHLFQYEDLKVFEEMDDLKYYYLNGYHITYNSEMGDAITTDLLKFIEDSQGLKFKFFIGHTSNILSVITRFNLFRDKVDLSLDNIHKMTNRKWKSSFMTPIGCNIMVVIYDCGYKIPRVTFYLNENPITMVMNDGNTCTKCPLNEFKDMLKEFNMKEHLTLTESMKEADVGHILAKQANEEIRRKKVQEELIQRDKDNEMRRQSEMIRK